MKKVKQDSKKQTRTGIMLLIFGLLPIICLTIAITIPMLSAFSGLQKLRKLSDNKPLLKTYEKIKKTDYQKTLSLIKKFIKSNEKKQLELSVNDLNSLIKYEKSLIKAKGYIKITNILQDKFFHRIIIKAKLSLPMEEVLHEPNFFLNKDIDFHFLISNKTLIRKKEVLLKLNQIFDKSKNLDLEIIHIWREKNLIDLWIDLNFSKEENKIIKNIFDTKILSLSVKENKLILKNYLLKKR